MGFSFNKKEINLNQRCDDLASKIYWAWLLEEIQLSVKNAELHNIYEKDSCAIFYDLNNDGEDEIIATHYNTAKRGNGQCLLFILQKIGDKYRKISSNIYFDVFSPIFVFKEKTNEYKNIEIKTLTDDKYEIVIYDKNKKRYLIK